MRVTNNMLSKTYMANLNSSLSTLNSLNTQVSSGKKMNKASDDPASALKALQVKRNLARVTQYQNNLRDADSQLTETETSITSLKEMATQAYERTLQGKNGTLSENDRKIIAQDLQDIQDQILLEANANFSGRYILGGANTTQAPFTVTDGKLYYNGQDLDKLPVKNEDVSLDLGMGLQISSGDADPDTAFTISTDGSEVLGSGFDAEAGVSNNLYNIIGTIADCMESNDMTNMDQYLSKLQEKSDDIMVQIVKVGERSNFVGFLQTRYESAESNLTEKQINLENVDLAEAIVDFTAQQAAYEATLQMGTRIIEPSLMDFLS